MCLVTWSAYGSIYLNVKGYETKNKAHDDIEYEQDRMAAAWF